MYLVLAVLACLTPAFGSDPSESAPTHLARLQCEQGGPEQGTEDQGDVHALLQTLTSTSEGDATQNVDIDKQNHGVVKTPEEEKLGIPPGWVRNVVVVVIVAVVVAMTAVGFWSGAEGWAIAMFAASYAILIPGLFVKDFSFNIAINVDFKALGLPDATRDIVKALMPNFPSRIQVTQPRGHYGPIHESTRSMVEFLYQSGSVLGAVLMALFAFGMPGLKLILWIIGMSLRKSKSPVLNGIAAWSISFVQVVSKWAAPDMFAFILLYHLLSGLDNPPLVEVLAQFDLGFSFYTVFCVFSVISTLAVRAPEPLEKQEARTPAVLRLLGTWGVRGLVQVLSLAWLLLFVRGLFVPCLKMRLDEATLLEQFHVPPVVLKMIKPLIDKSGLAEQLSDDVSLWSCSCSMLNHFIAGSGGHLNCFLAALIFIVFVLFATVLDMLLISLASFRSPQESAKGGHHRLMQVIHFARHLSFMDVLVVGVIVVSRVGALYAKDGIVLFYDQGLWFLLCSEICHWMAYMLAQSAWG